MPTPSQTILVLGSGVGGLAAAVHPGVPVPPGRAHGDLRSRLGVEVPLAEACLRVADLDEALAVAVEGPGLAFEKFWLRRWF